MHKSITYLLISFLTYISFNIPAFAADTGNEPEQRGVLVLKASSDLEQHLEELKHVYEYEGTDAVAQWIQRDLMVPYKLINWQRLSQSAELREVEVKIHKNESKAIEWMNQRFARMGIPNLKFKGIESSKKPDPTALHNEEVKGKKWLRYLAGPGVALAATVISLPENATADMGNYMLLILPAAGVGVTSILLEWQFAWPWLNNKFWKHVWKFGGRVMGRVSNIFVNFLYGMSLYGAGVGAANLPVLFDGKPVPYEILPFEVAVSTAFVGGVLFHIAMGQFQTDISTEEERGSLSGYERYSLETTGVVVNNGARVFDWVMPGNWGYFAQSGFFLLKTFPQLLKTNISHYLEDRKTHRQLNIATAPKINVAEKCAHLLSRLSLVNLPLLRK